METKSNGDLPAFPGPTDYTQEGLPVWGWQNLGGLTKREHYAGLAMQGILSNHNVDPLKFGDKLISELSVFFADALIAALEKKEGA